MLKMKYFVLKPEGDSFYAAASRQALLAYAQAIYHHDSQMADALREWADAEGAKVSAQIKAVMKAIREKSK